MCGELNISPASEKLGYVTENNDIDADPQHGDYIAGYGLAGIENSPEYNDDVNGFEYALALQEAGQFDEAIEQFIDYIEFDPEGLWVYNSMQRLLSCYRSADRDLCEIRDLYLSWSDEWSENLIDKSWAAKRLAGYCTLYSLEFETALDEFHDLLDEAPRPSDSLFVEMDILHVESYLDENHIDQIHNKYAEITRLEDLLDEIDENVSSEDIGIPECFDVANAYPNPFNSFTTIRFQLPESNHVLAYIFDINGRKVSELINDNVETGYHNLIWDATEISTGVYFCRLEAGQFSKTIKLALVK